MSKVEIQQIWETQEWWAVKKTFMAKIYIGQKIQG